MLLETQNLIARQIIRESEDKETPIKSYFQKLYDEGVNFIKEKEVELGSDLKFLLTFGAGIPPLSKIFSEFYQFKYPELNTADETLLVISLICLVFFESLDNFKGVNDSIVERGLEKEFETGKQFLKKRNNKIENLFSKIGLGVKNYSNIIKFSALVPLMPVLTNMINEGEITTQDLLKIFGAVIVWFAFEKSGDFLKEFFSNIIKSSKSRKK